MTDADKASAAIKKSKPGVVDGIVSVLFASIVIGLILFVVSSIAISTFTAKIGGPFSSLGGLSYIFVFFGTVILLPLMSIVGLLILGAIFRLAANFAGGKGDYNTATGYIGITMSVGLLVGAIFYMIIFAGQMVGLTLSFALFFLILGIAYLIFGPLMGLIGGFFLDLISHFEKVSVPRSGLIEGLTMGILMFIIMLIMALIFMAIPIPTGGGFSGFGSGGFGL